MGTNYYMIEDTCECCGKGKRKRHIGKSSAGWCFSLRVYPEDEINSLDDWRKLFTLPGTTFRDEYGTVIAADDILSCIEDRGLDVNEKDKNVPYGYGSWERFHELNNSERGPNNLLRHRINGRHCVGHGNGTFDYIIGEFF